MSDTEGNGFLGGLIGKAKEFGEKAGEFAEDAFDKAKDFAGDAAEKAKEVAADLPNRVRCDLTRAEDGSDFFEQRGQQDPLPEDFSGWAAYAVHDGVAHATTAHRTFRRMERTSEGGLLFPPEQLAAGGRCSVYAVDQTGRMRNRPFDCCATWSIHTRSARLNGWDGG